MRFSSKEILDLTKAWVALSIAFAILISNSFAISDILRNFLIAALTVGLGFVFHDLFHKFAAGHYGHGAEFRSYDFMLLVAIAMSFIGLIIAAPGSVMIKGMVNRKEHGLISAVGILGSFFVAFFFLLLSLVVSTGIIAQIASYGLLINSWLVIFNLIPVGMFDGSKVWEWSKGVYGVMVGMGLILLFLGGGF